MICMTTSALETEYSLLISQRKSEIGFFPNHRHFADKPVILERSLFPSSFLESFFKLPVSSEISRLFVILEHLDGLHQPLSNYCPHFTHLISLSKTSVQKCQEKMALIVYVICFIWLEHLFKPKLLELRNYSTRTILFATLLSN